MSDPAVLADHIDARVDAIIAAWRDAVDRGGDVPEAERLSHSEFVDHVPDLLERLADRLRGRGVDAEAPAREHGRLRWRQGYDVAEVIRELGHLRSTLIRATFAFARRSGFDDPALESAVEAIDEIFHEATADSVVHHQEEGRRQSELALEEIAERTRLADAARADADAARLKLHTVLASLPVGVCVLGPDGTALAMNPTSERLQGIPAGELIGRPGLRLLHPGHDLARPDGTPYADDDIPMARALRGEAVAGEEVAWTRRADGARLTAIVSAAPIVGDGRALLGAVVVVQDITDRKRMEEELRAQQRSYRDLYDHAPDMMLSVDARDARVVECNQTLADMLGYPREQILGRPVFDFYHPDSVEGARAAFAQFQATGIVREAELRVVRRDGSPLDISLSATAMRDADGRIVRSRAVWRDLTVRKRLEAAVARRENEFRAIAEQSPVLIWRSGVDGLCDYFNRAWLDFRGRTFEQERGEGWIEGIHPDDRERCLAAYLGAFARREPFKVEYRLLRHDGAYRWLIDHGAPFYDEVGGLLGYLGSCIDITERIELEYALERQKELALESSRHKTHLMSALSHDARTPLHAVVLAAELLEVQVNDRDDPEVRECLRTIRHSVRNVLDLLGDLLDLSRIDAGAAPLDVARFALAGVIDECVSSVENQARLKGLDLRVDCGALNGASLETDRSKLKQILGNLLSNAVRYTERGRVRVACGLDGGRIVLAVEDTGVGIAPADQAKIFDEFARLEHARRVPGEGTGLGLAICRRLASLLGGEITLRSEHGRGSTFALTLPDSILRDGEAEADRPRAVAGPGSGAVLVVEDHDASRQYLAKVLARMGYRPIEAGDGRQALDAIALERPMAVLLDVNMPVMDGVETTLALRANPATRDLPVFALTGDVTSENQRRIGEAGVNGFLEKPVTRERLQEALDSLASVPGDDAA